MKQAKYLFLVLIISLGCKNNEITESSARFGESFTLKANGSTSISSSGTTDNNIKIRFSKINFDSRCPKSMCHLSYGSTASINLLFVNKKDTSNVSLIILGCLDEYECNDQLYYRKDTLGYRFSLLRLDPYPNGTTPTDLANYSVKLNVVKL